MGDTFSIAWRTFDAQFWGVPQRRKRIYLVADFGGNTAPKILFEREGLSRDFKESREAWQGAPRDTTQSTGGTGETNVHCYDIGDRRTVANESIDVAPTLLSKMGTGGNNVPVVIETHGQDARWNLSEDNIVQTLASNMGTGGGNVPMILDKARSVDLRNQSLGVDKSQTLHGNGHGESVATVLHPIPIADKATRNKGGGDTRNDDGAGNGLGVGEPRAPAYTLTAADRHGVAYAIDRAAFNQGANAQYNISIQEELAQTLVAKGPGGVCHQKQMERSVAAMTENMGNKAETYQKVTGPLMANSHPGSYTGQDAFSDMLVATLEYIVRRLTPLECCRLQGFPDYWTQALGIAEPTEDDILYWRMIFREQAEALGETKKEKTDNQIRKWLQNPSSDSAVYKMWGNGIALPNAMFVMEGIAMILQEENEHEE